MNTTLPDFTAYELNELSEMARRENYYKNTQSFVMRYLDHGESVIKTDRQRRWLWAIKKELADKELADAVT